jgi:hypothetical protein
MPVTMLPNVENEQLLFVTLDLDRARDAVTAESFLIERRSDLGAVRVVFLKAMHEIKQFFL